jgi:hypothetical protein
MCYDHSWVPPGHVLLLQVLYLMRHGITEMNEYLARDEPQSVYGSKHFRDPLL